MWEFSKYGQILSAYIVAVKGHQSQINKCVYFFYLNELKCLHSIFQQILFLASCLVTEPEGDGHGTKAERRSRQDKGPGNLTLTFITFKVE